jgi:hypothetical protein
MGYCMVEVNLEAESFSEMFLPVYQTTQYITLQKNEVISFFVMRTSDLLCGESYYM